MLSKKGIGDVCGRVTCLLLTFATLDLNLATPAITLPAQFLSRDATPDACLFRVSVEKVAVHKYPLRVAPAWASNLGRYKALEGRARYEALDREATKECLAAKRAAPQDSTDKFGMR